MTQFYGTSGNDTLSGGAGSDYLDGGAGADAMAGGAGDDVYAVDDAGDAVLENPGDGTDRINSLISVALGANVENLWLVGTADSNGTGNGLDNVLWGNGGANVIDGGAGNDVLDGGAGNDTLIGGDGNDTYWVDAAGDSVTENANEGSDTVVSSLSAFGLGANLENLTLASGAGSIDGTGNELDNILSGNEGNNTLIGGAGNDSLDGGAGIDTLTGNDGNDIYRVDNAGDLVVENPGEGCDSVISTAASYSLAAAVENLTLGTWYGNTANLDGSGNELANEIRGNSGDNRLAGNGGDDTLVGGNGNDVLTGGSGHDTFYISTADAGTDLITDLASGDCIVVCPAMFTGSVGSGDGSTVANGEVQIETTPDGISHLYVGTDDVAGADLSIDLTGTFLPENFRASGFTLLYDTNHAPELTQTVADQNSLVGKAFVFQLPANLFTDPDVGDSLSYSAALFDLDWGFLDLPGWLQFDPATGSFTGTPGAGDQGSLDLLLMATDGAGASSYTTFSLQVLPPGIYGDNLANTLSGTTANDSLYGLGGNDVLNGYAGNDLLDGGLGNDTMKGGTGNDLYVVDAAGDLITEANSAGIDTVESGIAYVLGSNLENLTLTGSASINGTGNGLANVLIGNAGDNLLNGAAGIDTLAGGIGNDSYVLDQRAELGLITENPGEGTDGLLIAFANSTSKALVVDLSAANLVNVENLQVSGSGLFNLVGNAADNQLSGNAAANTIAGGAGDDTLNGGNGNDILSGGAGDDHFVFSTKPSASGNKDKITDFASGSDEIWLSAAIYTKLTATAGGLDAGNFIDGSRALNAGQHVIFDHTTGVLYYDPDGSGQAAAVQFATLTGVASLQYTDFHVF